MCTPRRVASAKTATNSTSAMTGAVKAAHHMRDGRSGRARAYSPAS
jgi:hypothetical protein